MLTLTNEQRACFGLSPVDPAWRLLSLPRSKYDEWDTFAYIDDASRTIRKVIKDSDAAYGSFYYHECEVNETLSEDGGYILPKTVKGKPVRLSAATLDKRPCSGMLLSCGDGGYITVYNHVAQQAYYHNAYDTPDNRADSREAFAAWVDRWCAETTPADIAEVAAFAQRKRVNVTCGEGDLFRFKLGRRLYGYGRIVLDIRAMRKAKVKFWDCYAGKPLIVAVYRIVTDDPHLTPDDLLDLPMLPAEGLMDNALFYGEYPIIGHEPVDGIRVDFPVNYSESCASGDHRMFYQCGRLYREKHQASSDVPSATYAGYAHSGSGYKIPCVTIPILEACIRAGKNDPYWKMIPPYWADGDLRNPKLRALHDQIRGQFGLPKL